jgi:hypothetical protein
LTKRFWIKKSEPDFNLLGTKEMKILFPGAEIICETKFGMTKSIMAVRSDKKI